MSWSVSRRAVGAAVLSAAVVGTGLFGATGVASAASSVPVGSALVAAGNQVRNTDLIGQPMAVVITNTRSRAVRVTPSSGPGMILAQPAPAAVLQPGESATYQVIVSVGVIREEERTTRYYNTYGDSATFTVEMRWPELNNRYQTEGVITVRGEYPSESPYAYTKYAPLYLTSTFTATQPIQLKIQSGYGAIVNVAI